MKKEWFVALKVYLATWALVFVLMLLRALRSDITITEAFETFTESLTYISFLIAIHVLFCCLYVVFLLARYFIRLYHKKGRHIFFKRLSIRLILPVSSAIFLYQLIIYKNTNENYNYEWDYSVENKSDCTKDLFQKDGKHRGMSVFGWRGNNKNAIASLVKNNIEWVAMTPFLYQKDKNSKEMTVPKEIGKWSKRDSVFIKNIKAMRQRGIHIQLKPHLWLGSGWRSDIKLNSEKEWDTWFDAYRKNMIHYAILAETTKTELLCIGTELRTSLENQQQKWKSLIKEIKTVYNGKLTYAANWDGEFNKIEFWSELDYIGIQAYFPLTKKEDPDLKTLKEGWVQHISLLETLSQKFERPILFTEVGYKSEASATIKPWEWDTFPDILYKKKSNKTQQLAYEALFECLWDKEWFSGLYIWQWNIHTEKENATKNIGFSPRFKPAQNSIAKWYSTVSN